jgi:predicted transcriptional regulator
VAQTDAKLNISVNSLISKMITVNEIANRLVWLCNNEKFVEAYTELFADDAVSIDPAYNNEPLVGLSKLIEREKQFLVVGKIHYIKVSDPIFAGDYFTVNFTVDFTVVGQERKLVEELAIYKVENEKIVSQQFFIG